MILTEEEISEIEKRAEEASDGDWHVDGFHLSAVIVRSIAQPWKWQRIADCDTEGFRNANWRADSAFIANAKSDIPSLISTIRWLQEESGRMKEALKPFAAAADVKLCGEWHGDHSIQPTDTAFHVKFKHLRAARAALKQGAEHD